LTGQIKETIKLFALYQPRRAARTNSRDLRDGKKIIITTVQKFPFILDDIGNEHRENKFAIIIGEAHSGQGGARQQR